jgi:hypothetical protein
MAIGVPSVGKHATGPSHDWDGLVQAIQAEVAGMGIIPNMLRWLRSMFRRASGLARSNVEMVHSIRQPDHRPGRRRMSTTVEEFDEHLARRRAEKQQQ